MNSFAAQHGQPSHLNLLQGKSEEQKKTSVQKETAMGKEVMDLPLITALARLYYNIPLGLKYRGTAEQGAQALVK